MHRMKTACFHFATLLLCLTATGHAADWQEILGPAQGTLPAAQEQVDWRENRAMDLVLAEARKTGRPVFVTFRCLPCKQCAGFDQAVLEGGDELSPLLRQFITVRLTDANLLDHRIFPYEGFQDLDLSWWGYFLSPEGRIYGIFGGKDHVSDATRISPAALANTLKRVLEHHYDPRRKTWNIDGPAPVLAGQPLVPRSGSAWQSWSATRPWLAEQACVHCHQVAELVRQPKLDSGKFDPASDLYVWPLPENTGIYLERDHGLRVQKVEPGSPAARAGLKTGDELGAAGGRKLFGQADFRGVLHRNSGGTGTLDLQWKRGDQIMSGSLKLSDGWKKTEVAWRKSVYDGNIGTHPHFFPLKGPDQPGGKMTVKPYFGKDTASNPAWQAGLRPNHLIIAIDGKPVSNDARKLMTWFRLNHQAGSTVELNVLENNKPKTIRYKLKDPS